MSEYERTLTAQQFAQTILSNCFIKYKSEIYINYNKIPCIYHTIHQILANTQSSNQSKSRYRYLDQDDIKAIQTSYQAIADYQYNIIINEFGSIQAVPFDQSIPQPVFSIISEQMNLILQD